MLRGHNLRQSPQCVRRISVGDACQRDRIGLLDQVLNVHDACLPTAAEFRVLATEPGPVIEPGAVVALATAARTAWRARRYLDSKALTVQPRTAAASA